MQQLSVDELQNNLAATLNAVSQEHAVIKVEHGQQAVILMDSQEYDSLMETLYLLQNNANVERLQQGIAQHQNGQIRHIDVNAYLD